MNKLKIFVVVVLGFALMACASKKNTELSSSEAGSGDRKEQKTQRPGENRGERPKFSDLLATMDTNKDGLISSAEAQGPFSEMFSKIDIDKDGNISEDEFSNMKPPQRRSRQ